MTELVCIAKGAWIVRKGKMSGEISTGPAFNEIVIPIDEQRVCGHPAYRLLGYEGTHLHQNWYRKEWFAPLISDEELEKELLAIPCRSH